MRTWIGCEEWPISGRRVDVVFLHPHSPSGMAGTGSGLKASHIVLRWLPPPIRARIDGSETLRRFLKLASWSLVAFALDKAALLAIVFLLARILGAADYGRLTLAQGAVNTAQIFVVLGAGTMLARYIPAMREDSVRRAVELVNLCALVVLSTATIFTIGGLLGAPVIATAVLDLPESSIIPYGMVAWVLLTALNSLLLTVMLSFEKGQAMGLVSLVGALLTIAAVPALAVQGGLTGAMMGLVAVEAAKGLLLLTLYRRMIRAEGVAMLTPVRRGDAPLLWRFGLPVFLNSALWGPTMWLAQLILKTRAPDGLAAVGVFGFTNSILGAVIVISGLTNRAALPILSSLDARGDRQGLWRATQKMALAQTAIAALIGLPIAVAAPMITGWAGPEFQASWAVIPIMIAVGVVIAGQTTLGNFLLVRGRPYFILGTMAVWAAVVLGMTTGLSAYGVFGLVWALFTGAVIRTCAIGWKSLREARAVSCERGNAQTCAVANTRGRHVN